ncbi:MAG: hypothetical protein INR71_06240 [Terriglobus roseus]|nr:hypothetical protein [Terriglobus roseus]
MPRRTDARRDDRIVVHFDLDAFYASVFEVADPALRSRPLAVQQVNRIPHRLPHPSG